MNAKRMTALLLSGILLCFDCSSSLAAVGAGTNFYGEQKDAGFAGNNETASPSDADELETAPTDKDEASLEASPSDAAIREGRFFYETTIDHITITVEAEAGVVPLGTTVKIEQVEYAGKKPILELVEDSSAYMGRQIDQVAAFDISLWYEGEEIEPESGAMTVTFRSDTMARDKIADQEVFHLEEESQQVNPLEATDKQADSITFQAEHFSIYGVALMSTATDEWEIVRDMRLYRTTDSGSGEPLSNHRGKINILIFGRMGTCLNTMNTAKGLEALLTESAAEKVNIFLLDIERPRQDVIAATEQASWNYIDVCSAPDNASYYQSFMWQLVRKTMPDAGNRITIPAVFVFDGNQTLWLSGTGQISQTEFAETLLDIDSTLALTNYVSSEEIYRVNEAMRQESRSDEEALEYYRYFDTGNNPEVVRKAAEITADASTDKEKLRKIYKWVAENVYYDRDSFRIGSSGETDPARLLKMNPIRCVCQGYANLVRDLCRAVGIPCREVSGYALGVGAESYWTKGILEGNESNHAWNEAYIDGSWMVLDATWDSGNVYENGVATLAPMREIYYGISLKDLSKDHKTVTVEPVDIVAITELRAEKGVDFVRLSWSASGGFANPRQFAVYYIDNNGKDILLTLTSGYTYLDKGIQAGEIRRYKVTYVAGNGYETNGKEIEASIENVDIPKEVTELRVVENTADHIRLEWNAQGGISVIARKNLESGQYEILQETDQGNYVDRNVVAGASYTYHIYNRVGDNVTEGVTLEVQVPFGEIRLPNQLVMREGTKKALSPEYAGFGEQLPKIIWFSSNPDIAQVDEHGNVTALGEGKAEITLTAQPGNYQAVTEVFCAAAKLSELYTDTERRVMELTNKERLVQNKKLLSTNKRMQQAAWIRKNEIKSQYSHTRPDGTGFDTVFDEVGMNMLLLEENIAQGYGSSSAAVNGWMNSPVHRDNILNDSISHMGAGEASKSWVQLFSACAGTERYMLLLPEEALTVPKGTSIEDMGIVVLSYCSKDGIGYIPLMEEICTGYDKGQSGQQTVTVAIGEYSEVFQVTVESGSGSSGGSSGGGNSGGGSGGGGSSGGGSGGGGSSSGGPGGGGSGGIIPIRGVGAGNNPSQPNQISTLPEQVMSGSWEFAEQGWRLKKPDGAYAANQWANINGRWYLMGPDSYMRTGWQNVNNAWYYMNQDGSMATGWALVGGKWYYLADSGSMVSGWILDNGRWYYLNPDGSMATGHISVDGKEYDMGNDGAMK